ncbi:MAG: hypothetical protein M3R59_11635 [Verrucomicrobiota bacterium]|nr:hypothetical protein [Verrucomicrobiota bacterium]MDQ2991380.1 hypothetical protein [Candidatus Eremiobacteraeota bacterium]
MPRFIAILVVALCVLTQNAAYAAACQPQRTASLLLAKSIGDVYNQLASDGDELPTSYFAKATILQSTYAYTLQTHRSAYDTQHEGPNTLTGVHTIAGPTISIPWFVATDETSEARVARCVGILGIYAGVGFVRTSSNYDYPAGYAHLQGMGIGLERFADATHRFDLFGALYYYPAASGAYGGTRLHFTIVTFDGGLRLRLGSSSIGLIAGLYQEMRSLHSGARASQTIRVAPYIGLQLMR